MSRRGERKRSGERVSQKIGLIAERQIGRSRSAHMIWAEGDDLLEE